jgi:sugar-specific transcriptional regulator TrmB
MKLKLLKELGLTEGEIKVYHSLILLRKSTISKIIEKSGVSSSKVYQILDKLVHKGLVNFIMVDNIKEFHLSNPDNLLDYINKEKEKLKKAESEAEKLVKNIKKLMPQEVQESAHIHRGLAGLKAAHLRLINELKKGEEYMFFSVEKSALEQEAVRRMFKTIHKRRDEIGVIARGISDPKLRKIFKKHLPNKKEYQIRYQDLTLNQGITIGKNRIIIETAHPEAFAVEIVSSKTAKSYQVFFNKLWKLAKP